MKISSLRDAISNFVFQLTQKSWLLYNSVISSILFCFLHFNLMQTPTFFIKSNHNAERFYIQSIKISYRLARNNVYIHLLHSLCGRAYRSHYPQNWRERERIVEWLKAKTLSPKPCVHTCLRLQFILDASPQITLSDKLGHPFSLISSLPSLFVTTLFLHWHIVLYVLLRQWQVWYFRFFMQPIFHAADSAHFRPKMRDFLALLLNIVNHVEMLKCWSDINTNA